ncbi:bromodomain-containing protein 8 [Drosophila persimilis]|uniref:bromodomain-containing protein 8 n=1 Tax=Drosophila persimilis TaxID=7234 RepID=UPI000F0827E3|nr:bromodomain-containing protein 8 [Drosophila persimilis]
MSAGVQERLQMSRMPLDTWTKREHLCLASSVSCSGDQNWITVSRTLKTVCGNGNSNNNNRPADWYSQKNCALQYGNLLESVEATKRKKRSSESSAGVSSPASVETPTELLLRRLTEERMLEIKAQMRSDQEMYLKIQREIDSLQSDEVSEQEMQDMWLAIEKEQDTKRIEEMKLENQMREREQRKKEMTASWRNSSPAARRSIQTTDTTSVDMDVEDISSGGNKQQSGPSPLLTSLLKSPTSSSPAPPSTPVAPGSSVARATAPTITSLLTSGASTVSSQPAITMKSPTDAAFMSRPMTGPPASEALTPTTPTLERSPSQAAPTLSMLLEKNKAAVKSGEAGGSSEKSESTASQEQPLLDDAESALVDPDEADQLLEGLSNIDEIIDDIDIDMASVIDDEILKEVDEAIASPVADKSDGIDFEDKLDALKREQTGTTPTEEAAKPVEVVIASSDDSNDNIPLAAVASQDNSKDRTLTASEGNATPEDANRLASEVAVEEIGETITLISTSSEDTAGSPPTMAKPEEDLVAESVPKDEEEKATEDATIEAVGEAVDTVKATEEPEISPEPAATAEEATANKEDADKQQTLEEKTATPTATVAVSLHDTDEETSSLTDSSKQDDPPRSVRSKQQSVKQPATEESKADQEQAGTPQPPSAPARAPLLRKLPHRDRSESPMVDDDTTTASDHSTARSSTRRRCSSTPVIDSIPNSPASSEHTDEKRETRAATKKLFLSIYATLQESKHAAPFRRPFHDEHAQRHAEICLRHMDLPTIKRNIDSGLIRSLNELHRDVLLMAHNVLLAYKPHTTQHKTARLFLEDVQALKEFSVGHETASNSTGSTSTPAANASGPSGSSSSTTTRAERPHGSKARSGFRKSQRHH